MDFKVADLRKKLNKLKFVDTTKTDELNKLMKEYEKVVRLNAEMVRYLFASVSPAVHLSVHLLCILTSKWVLYMSFVGQNNLSVSSHLFPSQMEKKGEKGEKYVNALVVKVSSSENCRLKNAH